MLSEAHKFPGLVTDELEAYDKELCQYFNISRNRSSRTVSEGGRERERERIMYYCIYYYPVLSLSLSLSVYIVGKIKAKEAATESN